MLLKFYLIELKPSNKKSLEDNIRLINKHMSLNDKEPQQCWRSVKHL